MKAAMFLAVWVSIDPAGGVVPIMTAGSDMVIQSIGLFRPMVPSATFQDVIDPGKVVASAMHTANDGAGAAK